MFKKFAGNEYSQHGEDGILEEIFKRLGVVNNENSWAVEFGAWDGKHFNNAFALVNRGWSCVMIEGDETKFQELLKTAKEYPSIHPINAYVSQYDSGDKSLFKILKTTNIPIEFELLSIDVDSYDSDIWETFHTYNPKVVCIEVNSNPAPGTFWRHEEPPPGEISRGTSFSEMLKVGHAKGYTLVCHTGNCIFVRNDLMQYLDFPVDLINNQDALYNGE